MVALMSESSSSSPRMASWRWRGVIRFTFKSLLAFPANSSTYRSQHKNIQKLDTRTFSIPRSEEILYGWKIGGKRYDFSSRTSAVKYSRMAALYTAAVAPTRPWLVVRDFRWRWIRPTGNCKGKNDEFLTRENRKLKPESVGKKCGKMWEQITARAKTSFVSSRCNSYYTPFVV